jgi:hypothetical protein
VVIVVVVVVVGNTLGVFLGVLADVQTSSFLMLLLSSMLILLFMVTFL